MKKYLAVFRSRTDVLSFIEDMRDSYAYASSVPTPKELKLGCGISAEFPPSNLIVAKKLISKGKYPSFYTFVIIEKRNGRTVSVKI